MRVSFCCYFLLLILTGCVSGKQQALGDLQVRNTSILEGNFEAAVPYVVEEYFQYKSIEDYIKWAEHTYGPGSGGNRKMLELLADSIKGPIKYQGVKYAYIQSKKVQGMLPVSDPSVLKDSTTLEYKTFKGMRHALQDVQYNPNSGFIEWHYTETAYAVKKPTDSVWRFLVTPMAMPELKKSVFPILVWKEFHCPDPDVELCDDE